MRWTRGSRTLRLPCVWLLLLSLAAGLGAKEVATVRDDDAAPTSLGEGDFASSPATADLEVTGGAEGRSARRGKTESSETSREYRSGRRLDEDEASRILWRGWLLVDEATSRRKAHITPKSVFITPVIRGDGNRGGGIPACAEGYRSDAMGRCHKVVRVNQAAHLDFLLQRLNALYGEPSSGAVQDATEKGPLLVTIPLATNPPHDSGADGEDEGDDDMDLVVVAEASIQEGPLSDLSASFTGVKEQVVAESHEEMVVNGEAGVVVDGMENKGINKSSHHSVVSASEKRQSEEGEVFEVKNGTNSERIESNGKHVVKAQLTNHPELGEPVTFWDSINSTEETSEQTEIPVTESTVQPTSDDLTDRYIQTTTANPTENSFKETNTESDVHFTNTHIYETTFIADYSTTDSYDNKVTVIPEILHKSSQEMSPDGNFSDHAIEDTKIESPKRVIFPGKVAERVRFPDSNDQQSMYPNQPMSSASSVASSITSPTASKPVSRPWGGWNRPMLLKFWTQMPLIREPTHGSESTIKGALPTPSSRDTPAHFKRGESWSFPIRSGTHGQVHHHGPYQRRPWIYYQEFSPREMTSVSRVFDRVRNYENHG